jgi:hypothetical protein
MHFMNRQRGRHMGGDKEAGGALDESKSEKPDINIKSHANGHTVHIMHPDGRHEQHPHDAGDVEGIAAHIHEHLGSGQGDGQQRPDADISTEGDGDVTPQH